jgi:transcription antitermination factor NusG
MTGDWFALQTKAKHEKSVTKLLEAKGYQCLLPTYQARRRWSDRMVDVEYPLFPCYVFCCMANSAFGKAIVTPGVTRIVGFGAKPVAVSANEIEALRKVQETSLRRLPWTYLTAGTRVEIRSGPLTGIQGIYSSESDHRRLVLSVELLQRSLAVQFDEEVQFEIVASPRLQSQARTSALAVGF